MNKNQHARTFIFYYFFFCSTRNEQEGGKKKIKRNGMKKKKKEVNGTKSPASTWVSERKRKKRQQQKKRKICAWVENISLDNARCVSLQSAVSIQQQQQQPNIHVICVSHVMFVMLCYSYHWWERWKRQTTRTKTANAHQQQCETRTEKKNSTSHSLHTTTFSSNKRKILLMFLWHSIDNTINSVVPVFAFILFVSV